jgi:high-affinity nickel-transport protein
VGFWFSLGHSSVVFGLCFLLAIGVRALAGQVTNGSSTLQTTTTLVGTLVSGTFLYVIGLINLVILVRIVKVFRLMKRGHYDEATLQEHLDKRGFMNRILGGVTKAVSKPRHMYPIGFLFGLGFDTASEVSLLVLAGGSAAFNLPWYAILVLPVLFAAGMSLLDTIDGCFMNFAYGWAFSKPVRKVFYNIVITSLSVGVALVIGTIELASVMASSMGLTTGPLAAVANINLNSMGFVIVATFVVAWVLALLVWRFGRIEDRWSSQLR